MSISRRYIHPADVFSDAKRQSASYGLTTRYSTGYAALDSYLGGGYGRQNGHEIVLVFGPTKIGKSFFALNLVADSIERGTRVGLLCLEDEAQDVVGRLDRMVSPEASARYLQTGDTIAMLPIETMDTMWKLDELLSLIGDWYTTLGLEVILLDHLQFAFENAEALKGENEYIAQRVFIKKLNVLVRKLKKTIILVSHVNKSAQARGTDRIVGSGGIAQGGTKLLGLTKTDGRLEVQEHGSRFTLTPERPLQFTYHPETMRLQSVARGVFNG